MNQVRLQAAEEEIHLGDFEWRQGQERGKQSERGKHILWLVEGQGMDLPDYACCAWETGSTGQQWQIYEADCLACCSSDTFLNAGKKIQNHITA